MAFAKVDGILINNDKIRKEQLKRVYWKDKVYTDFGGGDYVHNFDIETKEVLPIGDGDDLLIYTFGNKNDYSRDMLKKYMSNGVNHEIYEVAQVPDGKRFKWEGDYFWNFDPDNIRQRIAGVKLVEGERQTDFAHEGRFLNEKYITPELLNVYGNKTLADLNIVVNSVKGRLDGFIHVGEGRLADIEEAKVKVIRNISDLKSGATLGKYLLQSIEEAKKIGGKTPKDVYISDNYDAEKGIAYLDVKNKSEETYVKTSGGTTQLIQNEGDIIGGSIGGIQEIENFKTPDVKKDGLLAKTTKMFNEHKIATMIGRYHTSVGENEITDNSETIDTAKSPNFGNSHGRNLLKKNTFFIDKNGYENPYCRVWTYHHQYDNVSKLIRPFQGDNPRVFNPYKTEYIVDGKYTKDTGIDLLEKNTVLGKNGFVNIAPKKENCGSASSVEIKKCMFSLENLAWKDVPRKGGMNGAEYYISDEQRGPNGGRIMWFPPYDLNFQESVQVNWNQNNFIGRGEPVFTYSNTNRSGVLSFAILVDHPSIIDNIPANNLKESELSDDDILRYFAGCEIPEGFNKMGTCPDENTPEDNKSQSDEGKQGINKDKSKHIKFNVYFPNNYSGNGAKISKDSWNTAGSSDIFWYNYLLFGNDCTIPYNIPGRGYETSGRGISAENTLDRINVMLTTKPWQDGTGETQNLYYTYRVDFDLRQKLVNINKNGDDRGLSYNITNYADSKGNSLNTSLVNQGNTDEDTHTFAEIMCAMAEAKRTVISRFVVDNIDSIATKTIKYNELVELFKHGERIKKVKLTGIATNQNDANSKMLAERRCKSIEQLVKLFTTDKAGFSAETNVVELVDKTDINTLEAKKARCATCEIWYDAPEITNVYETTTQPQNTKREKQQVSNTVILEEKKRFKNRYETEADYFKNIKNTDPLIFKKLIEKFKYFSPAYHSISPEGFNARLTFLQQCTRQGHTIEISNQDYGKTAGNLAFGRMPVCVLRLGDFINTKILINGMSINYDANGPMQWDLNPEGIGVQPMYAKVSLQITILGGQSLEGPINRLQNAVSFNYYANTGVYDNRSDLASLSSDNVVTNQDVMNGNGVDNSEYNKSTLTYRHVFSPIPDIKGKEER